MKHLIILPTVFSLALGFSQAASALTCFFTLVKDSCWTDYDVTVKMTDADNGKPILSLTVPKGKAWNRQKFDCETGESLTYLASFSPVFWDADKGKQFPGKKSWKLPDKMAKGDTAWNITVCYPEEFAEVPLPPTAKGGCNCDARKIPPVVAPEKQ